MKEHIAQNQTGIIRIPKTNSYDACFAYKFNGLAFSKFLENQLGEFVCEVMTLEQLRNVKKNIPNLMIMELLDLTVCPHQRLFEGQRPVAYCVPTRVK